MHSKIWELFFSYASFAKVVSGGGGKWSLVSKTYHNKTGHEIDLQQKKIITEKSNDRFSWQTCSIAAASKISSRKINKSQDTFSVIKSDYLISQISSFLNNCELRFLDFSHLGLQDNFSIDAVFSSAIVQREKQKNSRHRPRGKSLHTFYL